MTKQELSDGLSDGVCRCMHARVRVAPVYEPGDLVLIFRLQQKEGLAEKLLHQYVGPYEVIRQVTELKIQSLCRK
ncbi:hypothetical protein GHT06_015228 [Daphnia sinensis]|uniref:Uncharacterized protein n=1 Tax=Daphnia sinensis TaxID=1820382 RepID=A0AAD5LA07_9CRUS|nr:hypothetical protein GHT06_015228 [Daphnia sinensis]